MDPEILPKIDKAFKLVMAAEAPESAAALLGIKRLLAANGLQSSDLTVLPSNRTPSGSDSTLHHLLHYMEENKRLREENILLRDQISASHTRKSAKPARMARPERPAGDGFAAPPKASGERKSQTAKESFNALRRDRRKRFHMLINIIFGDRRPPNWKDEIAEMLGVPRKVIQRDGYISLKLLTKVQNYVDALNLASPAAR